METADDGSLYLRHCSRWCSHLSSSRLCPPDGSGMGWSQLLGASNRLFSILERTHTADQFANAKKGWLGGKHLTQERGSHAAHMAPTIPCPASEDSGLKSWGFSYLLPPYSCVWQLSAMSCLSFAGPGSFLQTLEGTLEVRMDTWACRKLSPFTGTYSSRGIPNFPTSLNQKTPQEWPDSIFLCFAGEKRNTPTPNGGRDQQNKLPLYERTLLLPHIHWGKICCSSRGTSSAPEDWRSGCCLAGAVDAAGTQASCGCCGLLQRPQLQQGSICSTGTVIALPAVLACRSCKAAVPQDHMLGLLNVLPDSTPHMLFSYSASSF